MEQIDSQTTIASCCGYFGIHVTLKSRMEQPVIVFGASGLGKSALEIFQSNQIMVYGFLDDDPALHGTSIGEVPILGATDDQAYLKLIGKKCQAFLADNDKKWRQRTVEMLNAKRKVMPVNAIHSRSYMALSSSIGHGNFVDAGVLVNAFAQLGSHNILHAQCTLDAEVELKNYAEVGVGSNIGAQVTIGEGVFIGPGVTIVAGVSIGDHARIGAGSVVIGNVNRNETVFGNPAQKVDQ